ncbi:hypothetical protein JTE90_025515, partial [Oedothorax gibbosus]
FVKRFFLRLSRVVVLIAANKHRPALITCQWRLTGPTPLKRRKKAAEEAALCCSSAKSRKKALENISAALENISAALAQNKWCIDNNTNLQDDSKKFSSSI